MAENKYEVPAVRKAIGLIELLSSSHEAMGVTAIGNALDLNKHMVMRLLHTLEDLNWVVREGEKKYSLGLHPFYHTSKVVNRMSLKVAAQEAMLELWKKTGETTYLAIDSNSKILIVDILDSTRNVKLSGVLGGRYPKHTTAPGKVLLAYGDKTEMEHYLSGDLEAVCERSITDKEMLKKELLKVPQNGYATDNMESNDGGLCLAAPILDYSGHVIGSIGQTVVSLHYTMDEVKTILGPQIVEAAQAISIKLGYVK